MIIGIQDEILKINSLGLLDKLLADKTTKANILWATDAYKELGEHYQREKEITSDLITGDNSGIIKNRARKALEQQYARTRKHAEVFTPLWVVRKMNGYMDEDWFGNSDVFHKDGLPTEKVIFPSGKNWRQYVDLRVMEITCGEAPFLTSRYDVTTGESIPIRERIGILDRKLRVVNENAVGEEEWMKWTKRAYQSTYGYEFQGDNLLIARVNMLMTFSEYLYDRWRREPTKREYLEIVRIITWNIWQMDGLTETIPYCKAKEEYQQLSLFDWMDAGNSDESEKVQPRCRIYDWRSKYSLEYTQLNQKNS